MCGDSQCPHCKNVTDKISAAQQALAELHEKLESSDYSISDLPADAQLGYRIMASMVEENSSLAVLGPELNAVGKSLRLHLEAFDQEIKHMGGLAS